MISPVEVEIWYSPLANVPFTIRWRRMGESWQEGEAFTEDEAQSIARAVLS